MCEKNQLTFNYNKYDWILKKNAEGSSHEHKGDNNKNDKNDKSENKNEKDKEKKNSSSDNK